MQSERLLSYLQRGVDKLLEQGSFDGGQPFRKIQIQALEAYQRFLSDERLNVEARLKGFFEIPTGVGKTAVFIGIVAAAHTVAEADGEKLKTIIVVPTKQLLNQTKEAIEGKKDKAGFAPQFKGHIGLYGEGHKNLTQPITIMTYDAWDILSKAGEIGSHNIDIMISDEAHRGTSENRIGNIQDYFNETTAQIAFTATAHFDKEKSVQASHEHEIFYKPLPDAVREGELCRYIQSQSHEVEIEIPDDLRDIFNESSPEVKTAYRKKLRQTMWNKTSLALFREGRDERTGDPLSDNKSGFFVEGIEQADELEDMLNADPVLQAKAKELGCEYVGLAIHSRISTKEQKRRHKLYEQGKVMAIIGDEQFKEGSDYPHMKTIFDTKHGSQVDKVQIIGRGARFWLNPAKDNRDEGLTFVDIITYFQGEDAEETEWNREVTLRTAIRARDILKGDVALNEALEKQGGLIKEPKTSGGSGGFSVHIDGAKVKSYVTLESLFELSREVSDLRESYENRKDGLIDITYEVRKKIDTEKDRTGLGGNVLFRLMESPPDNLTNITVNNIINRAKSAYPDHIQAILETYALQPDKKPSASAHISEADHQKIQVEKERTGLGGTALFTLMPDPPDGLTSALSNHIVMGIYKNADPDHIRAILEAYAAKPDRLQVAISQDVQDRFLREKERTGAAANTLIKLMTNPPAGLTKNLIGAIVSGVKKNANPAHIDAIFEAYALLPDKISDEHKKKFLSEKERSGIGAHTLIKLMDEIPEGLSAGIAHNIIQGTSQTAPAAFIEAILKTYASLPDKKTSPVKSADLEKMKSELERTGLGGRTLFKLMDNPPEGLDGSLLQGIISGNVRHANTVYVERILSTYKAQPDKPSVTGPISQESKDKFLSEQSRTGLAGRALFSLMKNPPEGLTGSLTQSIVSGNNKNADPAHVDAILKEYGSQPASSLIPISSGDLERFASENLRTGIGGNNLFKLIDNPPPDVTKETIINIISGRRKSVYPVLLKKLFEIYATLPDKKQTVPISQADKEKILAEKARTGKGATAVFKLIANPPDGLDASIINSIMTCNQRAVPTHVEAILDAYALIPDKS